MVENKLMEKFYFLLPTDGKNEKLWKILESKFSKMFSKIFQNWEKIPSLGQKKFHQFFKNISSLGKLVREQIEVKLNF